MTWAFVMNYDIFAGESYARWSFQAYVNVQIIHPNNHISPFSSQKKGHCIILNYLCLCCFVNQIEVWVLCVMWGEALPLLPCKTSLLAVISSASHKGHECFLFFIHAPYVLSVSILTKWANFCSRGKRKKELTEMPENHWGLRNNGTPCCDSVILDTHRTPDVPLTIRRHSFCLTNHSSVCKSTLAALEREPWDNLTNMVTSSAKEKGKKAD